LKLQSAELVVKDAERKFAVRVITEYDLQKVKFARDLAAAEASGNPVEAARITLAVAELDLNVVGNQVAVGKATSLEYEQAKLTRDIAKIRYKLVQDGVSNPVTTAGAALNTNQEIARLKLQSAELVVKDAERKLAVRVITEYDLQKVKFARDLAAAEASGNPVEVARINLAAAELDLDVGGKKVAVGKATPLEYEQAKLARAAAKVRYQQVQSTTNSDVGNGSHSSTNRSDQIAVEDLALQMIVAIRGKDDVKLKSLATERIKGWTDA
jgi:outer membrane protein TolC